MKPCALLALLAGCTSMADNGPPPEQLDRVATLHAVLQGDGSIDATQVRFAIVWWRDKQVWPERLLEPQQLVVAAHTLSWPMHVELALPARPSYDPYYSQPSVGARAGRLVAYLDDNHNGKLDFTPINATQFTDRIIGFNAGDLVDYYTTVDVFAVSQYEPNVGLVDHDIATPLTIYQRTAPQYGCNLLEGWQPYAAYARGFGGFLGSDDPAQGPWDWEASFDPPCPDNLVPALTTEISCDAPQYQFHALETATPSSFIAQTCGRVTRVCEGWRQDPNAPGPWPCPCDSSKYYCTQYEGGL